MSESEQLRVRYKYRRMIVQGDVRVRRDAATPLVGPDCAYHLYAWEKGTRKAAGGKKGKGGASGCAPAGQHPD